MEFSQRLTAACLACCLCLLGSCDRTPPKLSPVSAQAIKKWRGTWEEPQVIKALGNRQILEIFEENGCLWGWTSTPEIATGDQLRLLKYRIDNFKEIDEDTIEFDVNTPKPQRRRITYIAPGASGAASAHMVPLSGTGEPDKFVKR